MHLLLPELMRKKLTHPGINCRENRHWDPLSIAKPAKGHLLPVLVTAEKEATGDNADRGFNLVGFCFYRWRSWFFFCG